MSYLYPLREPGLTERNGVSAGIQICGINLPEFLFVEIPHCTLSHIFHLFIGILWILFLYIFTFYIFESILKVLASVLTSIFLFIF